MNKLTIGILAHVDAGKTTLSEALLYESGVIRHPGRVDRKDAFLDNYALERERGITIFSKQAIIDIKRKNDSGDDLRITLLDTPGHVDFSAEMERTLRVLDLAILVISAKDGIEPHTKTLVSLLERYGLPFFVFVNKLDLNPVSPEGFIQGLRAAFGQGFVNFTSSISDKQTEEDIAVLDDDLLSLFLEDNLVIDRETVSSLIKKRKLFPCYFGSALKGTGVKELIDGLCFYGPKPRKSETFCGRVFKISRDDRQNRLTFVKVFGGELSVRSVLKEYDEKIDQIRLYNGNRYEITDKAGAGDVVALLGLTKSRIGDALGDEPDDYSPVLVPVLNYSVICPYGVTKNMMLEYLRVLEEEDPSLHVIWDEETREIRLSLMGQVQLEIIKSFMAERFGTDIDFREGRIIYKETIKDTVEGIGHFEPLRHYAEVHLLLEPMERGSGFIIDNKCSTDILSINFQNLVLTHLSERIFKGVLTGSEITDIKITLMSGKAHIKHTEGGDFRQAVYRAVRQGLMQAESILLEPWYEFILNIPDESTGRALGDLEKKGAQFSIKSQGDAGRTTITGRCPARNCVNYATEVRKYTKGEGELLLSYYGYIECPDTEEIINEIGYEPERDTFNSADSVFCEHGAGVIVPWYEIWDHMHLPSVLKTENNSNADGLSGYIHKDRKSSDLPLSTEEVDRIIEKTFFSNKRDGKKQIKRPDMEYELKKVYKAARVKPDKPEYILVDGYNVIFAWTELASLAEVNIDSARDKLIDILSNYQGLKGAELAVVFDAYRLSGHRAEILNYSNIHIIYTKEAQTADGYIEQFIHSSENRDKSGEINAPQKRASDYSITVVTSDSTERIIAAGAGCRIISSKDFREEVLLKSREASELYIKERSRGINDLSASLKDIKI